MALLTLAVMLAMATLAHAQLTPRCCLAQTVTKYSAVMSELPSLNKPKLNMMYVQADYNLHKQVFLFEETDLVSHQTTKLMRMVVDSAKNVSYSMPYYDPSKCTKAPYMYPMQKCIQDDAVYLGSTYLGPMGGGLAYDGWRFKVGTSTITIAMEPKGCVPVLQAVSDPVQNISTSYLYTNTAFTVPDPSLFELTDACKHLDEDVVG